MFFLLHSILSTLSHSQDTESNRPKLLTSIHVVNLNICLQLLSNSREDSV